MGERGQEFGLPLKEAQALWLIIVPPLAYLVPARRASRVDPVEALRGE